MRFRKGLTKPVSTMSSFVPGSKNELRKFGKLLLVKLRLITHYKRAMRPVSENLANQKKKDPDRELMPDD